MSMTAVSLACQLGIRFGFGVIAVVVVMCGRRERVGFARYTAPWRRRSLIHHAVTVRVIHSFQHDFAALLNAIHFRA